MQTRFELGTPPAHAPPSNDRRPRLSGSWPQAEDALDVTDNGKQVRRRRALRKESLSMSDANLPDLPRLPPAWAVRVLQALRNGVGRLHRLLTPPGAA